ncbi:MAG: SpoIIE family protein phosphatase [Thermodesulfobacteriota bacterium]
METELRELRDSNEFLNILLDNINSAVMIADENLRIFRVNRSFLGLFDGTADQTVGKTYGQAMGCIHTHREGRACGETSHCETCLVRNSLIKAAMENIPADRVRIEKTFIINGRQQIKIFEFTTRRIHYQDRNMILMMFYDITEIERQRLELIAKQRQLDSDLEAAAGIQRSLLPVRLPKLAHFDFAWCFEPCKSIGGDIFNVMFLSETRVAVFMIDVCGHGVSAALVAVAVSQFFQNRNPFIANRMGVIPPDQVLNRLNRTFPFSRFDTFFTIVYLVINLTEASVEYSCAGHPPPILLRQDGDMTPLAAKGPVIGSDVAISYPREKIWLNPGEKLILYTDGILENQDAEGRLFGQKRFQEALAQRSSEGIQRMVDGVYQAAKQFSLDKGFEDDVSLLGIAYNP